MANPPVSGLPGARGVCHGQNKYSTPMWRPSEDEAVL
jgi:hypothetical protein